MMELVVQYGVTSREMERAQRELGAGSGIGETVQEILIGTIMTATSFSFRNKLIT
jgi:hypothetical protein